MFESDNAQEEINLSEQVTADLEASGNEAGGDEGSAGVVDTTPQGTQPQAEEDPVYEVKVGGKTFKVPLSELRNGYQRQSDYSRKTMEIAEMRKNWERERQGIMGRVQELRQWISNPDNLRAYYQQLTQNQIEEMQQNDEPLTPAKAQQMIEAKLRQQQFIIQKQQEQALQQLELKQSAQQINADLNETIKGLLSTHPELGSVDGIEALLYRDVAAQEPESPEDAKRMFAEAAARRAEKIRSLFTEQRKKEVVQEGKLKNGIQPPGGTPVLANQQKKFKLGTSDLVNQVVNDLMNKE